VTASAKLRVFNSFDDVPSESTMSTTPVKRIDPLLGFMKTFELVKVIAKTWLRDG
jgi:hypothetical protein